MAKKTIKYSKNETTNVFENFEPWHYGEPAIPDNLYFLVFLINDHIDFYRNVYFYNNSIH